jgi:hypothetical membrane protein
MARKVLVASGVASSLYYLLMNIYVPLRWDGYSFLSQVPSELSAIGAPTQGLWNRMGVLYAVLLIAFGIGVRVSAGGSRPLRLVGWLFLADGLVGAFWPPMHLRGVEPTLTDTLHIVWSMAWLLTMLLAMGLAAAALGRRFRLYTFATLAVFLVFGFLTAMNAPRLAADLPTPWIGLWERINIAAAMTWIAALAVALLRQAGSGEEAPST